MTENIISEGRAILLFAFGTIIPLILSAMVPNGFQRIGGAVCALLGIALAIGMIGVEGNAMRWGLVTGFSLASIKLAAGLRFL
ncbi:MAG: hypothetical protein CL472_01070 [Acidobacteria bacterium]|nr:hypothetical protein [Acidobacteriota bacterium]